MFIFVINIPFFTEFIYTGSVSIHPDSLQSLLKTAKFLAISGLSSQISAKNISPAKGKKRKLSSKEVVKTVQKEFNVNPQQGQEELPVKIEPLDIGRLNSILDS